MTLLGRFPWSTFGRIRFNPFAEFLILIPAPIITEFVTGSMSCRTKVLFIFFCITKSAEKQAGEIGPAYFAGNNGINMLR